MLNIKVKAGSEQKAVAVLSDINKKALTHEGCITFMWFQHLEEPLKFTLLEQWENQQLMDEHIKKIIDIWNGFTPELDGDAASTSLKKLI